MIYIATGCQVHAFYSLGHILYYIVQGWECKVAWSYIFMCATTLESCDTIALLGHVQILVSKLHSLFQGEFVTALLSLCYFGHEK